MPKAVILDSFFLSVVFPKAIIQTTCHLNTEIFNDFKPKLFFQRREVPYASTPEDPDASEGFTKQDWTTHASQLASPPTLCFPLWSRRYWLDVLEDQSSRELKTIHNGDENHHVESVVLGARRGVRGRPLHWKASFINTLKIHKNHICQENVLDPYLALSWFTYISFFF